MFILEVLALDIWSEIIFYSFTFTSPHNYIFDCISDNIPSQIKILNSYPLIGTSQLLRQYEQRW